MDTVHRERVSPGPGSLGAVTWGRRPPGTARPKGWVAGAYFPAAVALVNGVQAVMPLPNDSMSGCIEPVKNGQCHGSYCDDPVWINCR